MQDIFSMSVDNVYVAYSYSSYIVGGLRVWGGVCGSKCVGVSWVYVYVGFYETVTIAPTCVRVLVYVRRTLCVRDGCVCCILSVYYLYQRVLEDCTLYTVH